MELLENKKKNNKIYQSKYLKRDFLENVASAIIGVGVVMFMQPLSMFLYSHSFKIILIGTLMFVVVSHFPKE